MVNGVPIVIIVIGVILMLIGLFVWSRRKELTLEGISNRRKKAFFIQWIIGLAIALIAAAFMFDGDILGDNTSGISTVMGIVGISLIATSNMNLLPLKRK